MSAVQLIQADVAQLMPTTIRDLAKQLNLSISTVSYALNDGPRSVPAEVKEKVLRLAKELDYRPNRIARSMVTGRTFTIGVVPSDQFENFILSPFILDCMNGIINECEKLNYDLLLFTRFSANEELKVADSISDGRVDGLIFLAPLLGSKLIEIAHRRGVPLVITHSHHGEQYATYTTNNFDTVSIAVNHLVSLGHKKIAHVYGKQILEDGIERRKAFEKLAKELQLTSPPEWQVPGYFTRESGYEASLNILKSDNIPTAFFCSNDEMAVGVYQAATELGFKIPEDISIVGVDNGTYGSFMNPQLTTVSQNLYGIAVESVRQLSNYIENGKEPTSRQFKSELVVRGSTAALVQ